MSSREKILAAVQASQPAPLPLPPVPTFEGECSVARFAQVLTSIGGQLLELAGPAELAPTVARLFPEARRVASLLVPATVPVSQATDHATLASIDVAVLAGAFGVCENGTVWLPEAALLHRALPTVAQHLVLALGRQQLVPTMHQAYARLGTQVGGYGVFLAGPSKTADIEQSLVIGAHGARSLTVLLHS